jgi:septum site-determining protein MinD
MTNTGRVIVITSGKGGVGKTTTTANLGMALAAMGEKVALLDADIGLRNLDLALGLENRIVYDIVDVVEGRAKLRQALIKDKRHQNLVLLPAAQTRDKSAVSTRQMQQVVADLQEEGYTFILIDCPAGIEQGFKNATAGATEAIVVTNPEMASVRDADRIIGLLEAQELRDPMLIVNRLRINMVRNQEMLGVEDVQEVLGNSVKLIGIVPDDESIITSTNRGEPVALSESSMAGQAYRNIGRRLRGETVPFLNLDEKKSLLDRLKQLFRG